MNHDDLACISCGSSLRIYDDRLECKGCSSQFPLLYEIPLFGNKLEIEQWTQYHIDPKNAELIAGGAYITEEPSKHNEYYSRYIPDQARIVLDAGGGDGNTTSHWAENHPEAKIYVMDLSLHGLKKVLRRELPNMFPICSAADQRFPFPSNYFDVVSTIFMVEHLTADALSRFYREAYRVLKPGGLLIVGSDTRFYDSIVHPVERFVRNGKYTKNDPTHINLMTPNECESGIRSEGYQLEGRSIHWVAGRHSLARALYKLLPRGFAEAAFSTMYVISARK